MNPALRSCSLAYRSITNVITHRPLCVSFEITHACNARCKHCHRGPHENLKKAPPEEFGKRYRELRPPVIQISGGEPLLRKDVFDIIKSVKQPGGVPYIIFVTNAALLTPEKHDQLINAGVDAFSVSLDYPDERHDVFRNIKGLYKHIESLCRDIGTNGRKTITLNCVVQSDNFRELESIAERASEWGVSVNFSPYTWLRTNDMQYVIQGDALHEFENSIERLFQFKKKYGVIRTSDSFFQDMLHFFRHGAIPGCRAGERFLVVNPDATLSPCGLIMTDYTSWDALLEGFTKNNTCASCHTCIRASTEKPFNNLLSGGLASVFSH